MNANELRLSSRTVTDSVGGSVGNSTYSRNKMVVALLFLGLIVLFLFRFATAYGDFTLMSKKHPKRQEIEDKVVWITGASRGIGEILANQLASLGAKLIISARNEAELERVRTQLKGKHAPGEVKILPLDLASGEGSLRKAVEKAESFFPGSGVDYMIHNAAFERPKSSALDVTEEGLKATFDVNVLGTITLTKLLAPFMLKRGQGHFVVMSSAAGKTPAPGQAVYSASKFALNGYFSSLRSELSQKGIRVTVVCPGPIATSNNAGSRVPSEKRVPAEKCAELTIIAATHGLKEAWISYQPVLAVMYLVQYMPTVGHWVMDKKLPLRDLYHRIFTAPEATSSVVPITEKWIRDGGTVNYNRLLSKRPRVNGLEEAEFYFNSIPKYLRTGECYRSLLNCYAHPRDVDRGESIMEKMRALGFATSILSRNVLLNLYYQTQNYDKLENLVCEMQEEGINFNSYTFGTLISAYAASSNTEGIDKLLALLGHNWIDWTVYAIAANCYRKQGLFEKAFNVLKNSERLITNKKRRVALTFLMTRYAAMIKKEVMRLWKLLTTDGKLYSRDYLAVIASVLKFEDFESAENIFKNWESKNQSFDIRIPNVMIGAYSKKGNMEAAESVVDWTIINNGEPNSKTWSYLSSGYIEQGDMEGAEELVRLLRNKDLVSLDVHKKLMNWIKDVESNVHAIDVLCGDSHKQTNGVSEAKGRQEQQ
ncbi:hypothetical protein Ahy_B04g073640 isoform A [Arachis hypogaea]|uniref:Ketoreductase domain-containing protein n=1 Tax=Arachis hypogaea TaxID=3818 RepID=A0A444ZQX2_ARAHY|nr:hypothetical protein Ahy_B04g073640 isoform A [Arachis hypogaea]